MTFWLGKGIAQKNLRGLAASMADPIGQGLGVERNAFLRAGALAIVGLLASRCAGLRWMAARDRHIKCRAT